VISGFNHKVDENCPLLGYYPASSGNLLPMFRQSIGPNLRVQDILLTFQDKLSVPSSGFKISWMLQMEPIGCPKTSVRDYHYSQRHNPEECSSHVRSGETCGNM